MNLSIEEQVQSTPKFSGLVNEDVVHWLQIIEELFDRFNIHSSSRYLIISFFLVADAAIWFRHNKENARDWFTFKIELVKFFHPFPYSFLLQMEQSHQLFHTPTSPTSIPNEEQEIENDSVDSLRDDQLYSMEAVGNIDLHEHEIRFSLVSVTVNDLTLESYPWNINKIDDPDELPQQRELVITSDQLQAGVDDPFDDLSGPDSPLASLDKSPPTFSRIFIPDYTGYHRFHYQENRYAVNNSLPIIRRAYQSHTFNVHSIDKQRTQYQDIIFRLVNEAHGYSHHQIFRWYFSNKLFELWVSFRKWKYRRLPSFSFFLFLSGRCSHG